MHDTRGCAAKASWYDGGHGGSAANLTSHAHKARKGQGLLYGKAVQTAINSAQTHVHRATLVLARSSCSALLFSSPSVAAVVPNVLAITVDVGQWQYPHLQLSQLKT